MGNPFFNFKAFSVQQGGAAMKVCTDACLFGALLPIVGESKARALDIGTGTGLLSLMYAQRNAFVVIDAIELEEAAYNQAKENFQASPWSDRIRVIQGDFRKFTPLASNLETQSGNERYDLIFSNPPFFSGDLKSADEAKNRAHHSSDLSFNSLVEKSARLLGSAGLFTVLIPFARGQEMRAIARENGLYLIQEYLVRQSPDHAYFRVIQLFSRENANLAEESICIREANQQYSLKFAELLRPYYLYL
ncbi:MAG TPA: methyltransferase [Arachidicoccus sp.]|nr:methyltransferase [Arachidicoccus sp.]